MIQPVYTIMGSGKSKVDVSDNDDIAITLENGGIFEDVFQLGQELCF